MKEFLNVLFHFNKKALFADPTDNGFIQFFRFIFVGGIATVIDIFVATVAYEWLGLSSMGLQLGEYDGGLLVANTIGFVIGLTVNYSLCILWIFPYKDINRTKEFISFTLIGLVGLGIKLITVSLCERFLLDITQSLLGILPMSAVIAGVGTVVAFVWNFIARKFILYRKHTIKSE